MNQPLEWHTEQRRINDLVPLDINPRKISEARRMKMIESLQKFNLVDIPVVDFDGTIISGHQRLRALQAIGRGEETIDVRQPNRQLSELERKEYNVLDNTHFGEFDLELYEEHFGDVMLDDLGVERGDLFREEFGEPEKPVKLEAQEDDYEVPDVIVTDIVTGDLFEIGEHRLLCGDSTNAEEVARVMGGEKADMVFTDPPYGVNVKGGKNKSNIAGDLTQTAIPFSFELCVLHATKPIATFYFCGGEGNLGLYSKLFERFLSQIPRHLIWVKNGFVMKPNGYHNQYEIIYYGYKAGGGGMGNWFGGRTEHEASDVWRVNRDNSNDYEHPTQKPVELASRAIRNSCPEGGLVYEPFSGSGSTFAAAHQLKRHCYGIEIDPQYCKVTLDRMLRLDPTLEVKRNGQPYTPKT